MTDARTLARLDSLIWILIFVGLFVLVLGIASHDETPIGGWSLSLLGGLSTLVGVVLIYVRSRLPEPPASAQSSPTGKETGR